ncbi:MAG TPA: MEDS domain-containing protein [Bryobacteraceae bacterium]|nr:MEDS domain-containing protein [Bryobacteraceae bacterium]
MAGLISPNDAQLLSALERFGPHDHLCSIYENQQDHFAVVVPFIRIGLERHEKCLYITDAESLEGVRAAMQAGGLDVAAALDSGALTLATKDQTYMRLGTFEPDWMFSYWREAAEQAKREGFNSLRATGETEWVVRGGPGLERWMEYECRLTHAMAESNAFALCQYNRTVFPPSLILDVIRTHPVVIYRGTVCRNFYFVPPEEFLGQDSSAREVERLSTNVREREQLDYELQRAHAELEERILARTQELREREEWLRLAQNAAGLGIADWDAGTGRARHSDELFRIYGLSPSERTFTFEQWIGSVHGDDRAAVREGFAAALRERRSWEGEFRIVRPDGTIRWIAAKGTMLYGEQGEPTRVIATQMDITERKRAEEAHFNAQKLNSIGLLAGGVAHDFNNILTGVLGNASLLLEDSVLGSDPRIEAIIEAAQKAAALTRQLLAYAGKGQFVVEELDMSEVARDMAGLLRSAVPKSIALQMDLAGTLPAVTADPCQMQQVLMNLVTNAAEAIGDQHVGTIVVTTGVGQPAPDWSATEAEMPPGQYVFVQVSDTGCGMDAVTRAQIFDPFFSTKFTGRGLGLAAVSGIVRAHGGMISVVSAPGAGSTFRVYLRAAPALLSCKRREQPMVHTVVNGAPKLLVVDDEECVREVAGEALSRHGYDVIFARDGQEAVAVYEKQAGEIDLVLLDLILPRLNGAQVLEFIRRLRPDARVLLMSGHSAQEAERLCSAHGAQAFLAKPYTAERLVRAVGSVIAEN